MRIAVIDGQGGGVGKAIVEKCRAILGNSIDIIALGTNSLATSMMLKAGANEGATGENAIVFNALRVDVIMGPIGIVSANSLLGELTPNMAQAISASHAPKILIPMNRCNISIAGLENKPLQLYVDDAVQMLKKIIDEVS
jgi:hypothetical protein